ncbi:MAG: oxidoreductase, partial [Oleibacter sp.]|nr:oxidoreductase [Thalassolituus sp.]
GVCGQCVTKVTDGIPEHRDDFLSADEKNSNQCVMPCVSRAVSDSLTLDL